MTLNDFDPLPKKIEVFSDFLRFPDATHISKVNCAEMAGDGPRQPAYDTFSIERTFLKV